MDEGHKLLNQWEEIWKNNYLKFHSGKTPFLLPT